MDADPGQRRRTGPRQRVCVACPRCGQGYRIPARLVGRRLLCRHCRSTWRAEEIPLQEFHSGKLTGAGSSSDSGTIGLPQDLSPSDSSGSIGIDTSWAGRKLGRYQVLSVLGHGGMAVVWRAHDETLRRDAALKILHRRGDKRDKDDSGGNGGNGGSLNADLFMQEARAIARLQHPSVVSIFEVGRETGQIFLALEMMEGGTLKEYVERYGCIPPRELWALMVGPARALALAHRRGIIHRDIKPTNLMFDDHGHLKLMDFGLADVAQEAASERMRGKTVGSLGWIAPETARAQPTTAASDIYNSGLAILYALTGRPWLHAPSRGELMALHRDPPPLDLSGIKGLTPRGEAILKTCLAVEPSDRYLTADRLADALQQCADEDPTEISRARKSHAGVAATAFLIGGLLMAAGALHYFNQLFDKENELSQPAIPGWRSAAAGPSGVASPAAADVAAPESPQPSGTGLEPAESQTAMALDGGEGSTTENLRRPWPEVFNGAELRFVGTSRGRVFHLPTSECGRSIYASNLLSFESLQEAREAGRQPCVRCRPAASRIGVAVVPEDD